MFNTGVKIGAHGDCSISEFEQLHTRNDKNALTGYIW